MGPWVPVLDWPMNIFFPCKKQLYIRAGTIAASYKHILMRKMMREKNSGLHISSQL
jgi:hypothetical protein